MDFSGTDSGCAGMKPKAGEESAGPYKKLASEISMHSLSEIKPRRNRQEMPFIAFIDEEIANLTRADRHGDAYDCSRAPGTGMDSSTRENLNMASLALQTGFTGSNPPGSAKQDGLAQQIKFLGHSGPVLRNQAASRSGASPLTIFYNGTVHVYNVSADKAQAVIWMAENGFGNSRPQMSPRDSDCRITTSPSSNGHSICTRIKGFSMISGARRLPVSSNNPSNLNSFQTVPNLHAGKLLMLIPSRLFTMIKNSKVPDLASVPMCVRVARGTGSDLPIARKHSLQRFLKKRKERLHSVASEATGGEVSMSADAAMQS